MTNSCFCEMSDILFFFSPTNILRIIGKGGIAPQKPTFYPKNFGERRIFRKFTPENYKTG